MLLSRSGILAKAIRHCIQLSATKTVHISRYCNVRISETVVRSCTVKKVFLKMLQNSQVFPLAQEFPVNFATF